MSPLDSSAAVVAYLAFFAGSAVVFLFVNLLVGKFLRPANPEPEKLEIYECGEPTIGSSFVQFDLRFYVIALLFIIFDVEVAFFFPWAAVFGKSTNMMNDNFTVATRSAEGATVLTPQGAAIYRELGVREPLPVTEIPRSLEGIVKPGESVQTANAIAHQGMRQLAWVTFVDVAAFFAILLIGFAYVWKRGDLDWVRALVQERASAKPQRYTDPLEEEEAQALSA
jgi:NADH-quinone oxidoreductase subunit A